MKPLAIVIGGITAIAFDSVFYVQAIQIPASIPLIASVIIANIWGVGGAIIAVVANQILTEMDEEKEKRLRRLIREECSK